MLLLQVLNHVSQIVARLAQALLRSSFRLTPRIVDGEIGYVPVTDEPPERSDARILRQPPQRAHREHLGFIELFVYLLVVSLGTLARDDPAATVPEAQDLVRCAATSGDAPPFERFLDNHWPACLLIDL